ncbi:MAG: 30S ribosomal protein S12 methylthiotransferase RimO [Bacteroidales bacterium]|nr:30S ribosomal protein S12 methylthiotransferase RimO [Bacteroidales bacterium]
MKSVQTIILGCSKNLVDMEHILPSLVGHYEIVPESEARKFVDYVLIDTCSFIGDSKDESINTILETIMRKRAGFVGKIVVMGCLPQRYPKEMPKFIPEVDAWFGARDYAPVLRYFGVKDCGGRLLTTPGHYAYMKISEGCDRRCSYCAIPLIRGAHKSVPMEELVAEAADLARRGVKELIVIAQDTTYYGLDLYGRRTLTELLRRFSEIDGIEWLRLHYSYPTDFPADLLDEMTRNPKICNYIDIPLQHISDKVLSMMHRGIDGAKTRELIRRFRDEVPNVALRTTMIVGHPGEGEAEFEELLDFVREAKFERLGAFEYSEEEDTFGAKNYKDEVPAEEKARRLDILMKEQAVVSFEHNRSRVGSRCRVLVDDYMNGVLICRSEYESPDVDNEIYVYAPKNGAKLVGKFVNVKITEADVYDLTAELI